MGKAKPNAVLSVTDARDGNDEKQAVSKGQENLVSCILVSKCVVRESERVDDEGEERPVRWSDGMVVKARGKKGNIGMEDLKQKKDFFLSLPCLGRPSSVVQTSRPRLSAREGSVSWRTSRGRKCSFEARQGEAALRPASEAQAL